MKVLKEKPAHINVKYLRQFPEFVAFHTHTERDGKTEENNHTTQEILEKTSQTPQEILEASYQSLRQTLAQELLERIKHSSPKFFESLVLIYSLPWAMAVHEKMQVK